MRVHHLLETTSSALTKIWEGTHFSSLIRYLEGGSDDSKLLARMLQTGLQKAKSEPERLFSSLKPLIKMGRDEFEHSSVYHSALTSVINGVAEVALKDKDLFNRLTSKVSAEELKPLLTGKLQAQLLLTAKKLKRTPAEEDYDAATELFIFVGRPAFKETRKGSGSFKKTLEIERLIKVDGFDAEAHQLAGALKFRARAQGEGSELYQVRLPAGTITKSNPSGDELDAKTINLIDKHKQVVR